MTIYGTPLEPGLSLTVSTDSSQNQVLTPQSFNVCYLLIEQPSVGTFTPNTANLVTSLTDYRNKIGGVPTTYKQLVDYLSVAAFFDNTNGAGLLQVIPVLPPPDISTLTIIVPAVGAAATIVYSVTINQVLLEGSILLNSTLGSPTQQLADELIRRIQADPILNSVIYIRTNANGVIEFAPYVTNTLISVLFQTPSIVPPGAFAVPASAYTRVQNPPVAVPPTFVDFGQALYTTVTPDKPLGIIISPGFFATETAATGLKYAALLDTFARRPKNQHLAYIDVPNPDFGLVPAYSTVASYTSGQALLAGALIKFNGSIYKGATTGLTLIPAAVNAAVVAVAARVVLPSPITIGNTTARVFQSINAAATFANVLSPTALELQKFAPIPDQLIISEALAAGRLTVEELSTSSEAGLYNWRDNFNSLEGHVSAVGPYQKYNGREVQVPYVIPASAYLAALHIKVLDLAGLSTPPASDAYPLNSTAGPIWDVTSDGHALLNGKGINIVKVVNDTPYVFGSRTLSKVDLYNRINNRAILSAYVRTLQLALNAGIVLRPLNSTGTQLSAIESLMNRVSESFYSAGLFAGQTSGDAFTNVCSLSNNTVAGLQQGIVVASSTVQQIGMIERLVVTVQETLLGS